MEVSTINAAVFAKMFLAGAKNLEAKKEWINELNVFPVPDGDTGTNMSMTIMSAAKAVSELENPTMKELAKAISSGSLRGARGNSGVILSQLFRGFTKVIAEYDELDVVILTEAMQKAVETAYKAVTEGHPESPSSKKDIEYLKQKVEVGCEFLTTQMFFDNNILYNFLYRIREAGINVPVIAGIMPVTNAKQIKRICSISDTALPQRFIRIVDHFGDNPAAMMQAGIAFATEQIIDLLANGINAVHIYSMNRPDVAKSIRANLSDILK